MKKNYGKIFKELRLSKGYSIKEISGTEISNATISKFEHGNTMLSIDKFFRVLSNINVSPREFFLYAEERLENPYLSISKDFLPFEEKKINIEKLQKAIILLEEQLCEYPKRTFLRVQIITYKVIMSKAFPDSPNNIAPQDLQLIERYLFGIKNWSEVELRIYCATIHLFDIDIIKTLTYRLISPLSYRLITPDIRWMMAIAIMSVIDAILPRHKNCLKENELFNEINKYLRENPIPDRYTAEKGFVKFNMGSFQYLSGKTIVGEQVMRDVIEAFTLIDCNVYSRLLIIKFEKVTGRAYLKV